MTMNTGVEGQVSSTQKYRCGYVMDHEVEKEPRDRIRLRQ